MTLSNARSTRRGAFTLVELIVVVSIIGILAALVGAGVYSAVESQRQSNTEMTMRTVMKVLNKQTQFVVDKADKENIPGNVLSMAGSDPRRARLIWKKLRLKQEFPISFAEA